MSQRDFFDEATVFVQAGKGGDGAAHFRREKFVPFGGPDGGDGGRGGSVYFRVDPNLNTLLPFRYERRFAAGTGGPGRGSKMHGKKGEDKIVLVPPGTVVRLLDENGEPVEVIADLVTPGEDVQVARGGRGGLGNTHFTTSTNQAPRFAQKGEPGEERWLRLELKLIADVGLLGFPNAGKSTFLAAVTAANPKIGDYPFTTLTPNLGVVDIDGRTFVLADIPGLIEGAHQGVGLGHDFLRHVQRTRLLLHLIDGTTEDPLGDFQRLSSELELYDPGLAAKRRIAVITKMDLPEAREHFPAAQAALEPLVGQVFAISAVTGEGVQALIRAAAAALAEEKTKASEAPEMAAEEAMPVLRPSPVRDEFELIRHGRRTYEVEGAQVQRMVVMTDLFNDEGYRHLMRDLSRLGVQNALERADVPIGAKVTIGEVDFVWTETGLALPPPPKKKLRGRRLDA